MYFWTKLIGICCQIKSCCHFAFKLQEEKGLGLGLGLGNSVALSRRHTVFFQALQPWWFEDDSYTLSSPYKTLYQSQNSTLV
jgi:hypothetical protein